MAGLRGVVLVAAAALAVACVAVPRPHGPSLQVPPPSAQAAALWGDVNCDRSVSAVDALQVLRQVVGLPVSQQEPCPDIGAAVTVQGLEGTWLWGDVDGDGDLDAVDALAILRWVVGLDVASWPPAPALGAEVQVEAVAPLQLLLRARGSLPSLALEVELTNVGQEPLEVVDLLVPLTLFVEVVGPDGHPLPFNGPLADTILLEGAFLTLDPGQSLTTTVDLGELYDAPFFAGPGPHRMVAYYRNADDGARFGRQAVVIEPPGLASNGIVREVAP